ncbi:Protein lin-37 [Amphibalanus amphitrite]|uniref:Protein lin-37 n=2 Tax=Amphibalanus amphitrite TaxID=1232801 RepID=A0A6A4WHH2_AMPAM|nr:Protein lin-37 [Amphibalanus amphitrite]
MFVPPGARAMDPISEARGQLQGALQAAGSRKRGSEWDSSEEDNLIDIQDISSPSRGSKRRRRKPAAPGNLPDTYVMKLFDRSVNLAQFPAGSSLYPVCRAWMANDPNGTAAAPPPKAEPKEEPSDGDLVYQLPPPLFPPLDEDGQPANLRVPAGLRPPDPAQLPELQPSKADDAPPKSQILAGHLARWRSVRDQWRTAAANNERRYTDSFAVLSSICIPDS